MKRALITGLPGFAGSHLAKELLRNRYKVYGTQLTGETHDKLHGFTTKVSLTDLDLRDGARTERYIRRVKPQYVFHLAAVSSVPFSFDHPDMTFEINTVGTVNLLEALRHVRGIEKIIIVTSSVIYGIVKPSEMPLKEDTRLLPVSPYGVSKAAVDLLGYQYFKGYNLPIIRARSFNHTGPNQGLGFVVPDFCKQVAQIEVGKLKPVMEVGNLDAERDISDVRDIVRGYRLLAEKGKAGEAYHLCSGQADKIRDILDNILDMATADIKVKRDPKRMRPSDVPRLVGNYSKAKRAVGYKPKYKLKSTVRDTLEYWRKEVRRSIR